MPSGRLGLVLLFLVGLLVWPLTAQQTRIGASIFVQEAEPTVSNLDSTQMWYQPSTHLLRFVVGSGPTTWGVVMQSMAGVPVVSACGAGPTPITGDDVSGRVTVGTGVVTSCTLTFGTARTTAPPCIAVASSTTVVIATNTTPQALTVTMSVTLGGGQFSYLCPL